MNNRLIESIIRKIKRYEKYHIAIHDDKWKYKMIRMSLEIMDNEKKKQFIKLIDKELSKLNPCATTRIFVLKDLRGKI